MTVFNGYMKIIRSNITTVFMYFGIFIGLAILMNQVGDNEITKNFTTAKSEIAIVDSDKSELSKMLVRYLGKKHHVTTAKNNKSQLAEELYYGKQDIVLQIKKGFFKNALEGKKGIDLTQCPGIYDGMYLEQQINQYLEDVITYHSLGYNISKSCEKVEGQKECKIIMEDLNGNGGELPKYIYFFQYFPYLALSALGVALGKILVSFRENTLKKRMTASPVSLLRQNAEIILAFLVMGILLYLFCILVAILMYGKNLWNAPNFVFYLINSFVDLLAALEISFLVGLLVKKPAHVDMFITPLSLGICFLCGVFVPQSVLAAPVKKVASFLPVYWYEKVNNLLADYADISGNIGRQVWQGIGIQALFLAALAGIGMVIVKYQQQER